MDAHGGSAEEQAGAWRVALVALGLAVALVAGWTTSSAPPVPSVCEGLPAGTVDVSRIAADVVATLRAACAG